MRYLFVVLSAAVSFAALFNVAIAEESLPLPKPKTVGWVENVRIQDVDLVLRAKLDTGAKTSSLDARVLETKKNPSPAEGYTDDTVIFSIMDEKTNTSKVFERDVLRYVRIKLKDNGFTRRPVVRMTFCIAGRLTTEEVNLAERDNFIYPVLVGRNMMQHARLLIDAGRTYVSRPACKKPAELSQIF